MKSRMPGVVLLLAGLLSALTAGAADGDFAWARGMGGPEYDGVNGMALDDSSNIYITGYFRGVMDFDPGPGVFELNAGDKDDRFVAKLDNAGNLLWAVALHDVDGYISSAIALDGVGNVYTTGEFSGTADFDPGPGIFELTGQNSTTFVWKLDTYGHFLWAKAFVGPAYNGRVSIAVDGEGNVYTTGEFCASTDFDPGPEVFELAAVVSPEVTFVSKLNTDGQFVWAKALHGTCIHGEAKDIAVDDAGYVYTTGAFGETMDFDPGPEVFALRATGLLGTYVSTLDKDGNFVRAVEFGEGHGQTVTVDGAGNLYTLGMFRGTVDFDPGPATFTLTAVDSWDDIFLSKMDRKGNCVWAIKLGGGGEVEALDFAVDASNNLYLTGSFNRGSADFDPGPETAELTPPLWGTETFIVKLDFVARLVWLKRLKVNGGQCIAVDRMEHTYTAGECFGLDMDTERGDFSLRSAGGEDVAIVKLYGPQPIVVSIAPADSTSTEGGLLPFKVTFSTQVTGVDITDFRLTATDTLSNSQIIHADGAGKEYTVMVVVSQGNGTLRLDLVDDDSITDVTGTPLGGLGKGNADYIVGDIHVHVVHVVHPVLPIRRMLLQSLLSLAIFPGGIALLLVVVSYVLRRKDRRRRREQ